MKIVENSIWEQEDIKTSEIRKAFQSLQAEKGELKVGDAITYDGFVWTVTGVNESGIAVSVVRKPNSEF